MTELIPLKEAVERLEVSRNTLRRVIAQHGVTLYENPRDAREKLVDWDELEAALRPRPLRAEDGTAPSKKAA